MTIGTWVVMQGLGSIALLLFALFPERLDIGAVFGNAMNVTMTGFILYLIIAFSSYGHRDAYYYAIAGWGVFIFPRSLVRVTSIALYAQFPSTSLPTALCGGLLLISAQSIFLQFLMLERDETAATKATAVSVQRLLGIKDEAAPAPKCARQSYVRALRKCRSNSCFPTAKPKCSRSMPWALRKQKSPKSSASRPARRTHT